MTMKKYLDLFEAAPIVGTPTSTAKPNPISTGAATSATGKPVRPGDASAYVGGPVDATAQVPDTSKAIPGAASKPVNSMQDFEEAELTEMMRLSGLAINEKAPPGAKAERMVKHIKKGYAKDGKLTKKEKGIAYATAWKQHNKDKVNESLKLMLDEEGHTLEHIVNRFKHEVKKFLDGDMMAENLYDALYDYYIDRGDMPYGVAKAREGDPYAWTVDRFYNDITADNMNEAPVYEVTADDTLYRLAELAGLNETDVKSGPALSNIDAMTRDEVNTALKNRPRDSIDDMSAADVNTALKNRPRDSIDDMSADEVNAAFYDKNNRIKEMADINECGNMGMDQHDSMNISTNMSSDGTKSVTISAQGEEAEALMQMLKLAGMGHIGHDAHREEPVVMISSDDEMMDETGPGGQAWVPDDGRFPDEVDIEDYYNPLMDEELAEAKKRTTRYVNTPDEEYQTIDSITRQGNDLNREKRQYADKPKLGDNPMAESMLDQDLNDILESILIRDDKEIDKDPATGRVKVTYPPPKKEIDKDPATGRVKVTYPPPNRAAPDQSELPLQNEPYHGPRSLKIDGEKTGFEVDEGSIKKSGPSDLTGTWSSDPPTKGQPDIPPPVPMDPVYPKAKDINKPEAPRAPKGPSSPALPHPGNKK